MCVSVCVCLGTVAKGLCVYVCMCVCVRARVCTCMYVWAWRAGDTSLPPTTRSRSMNTDVTLRARAHTTYKRKPHDERTCVNLNHTITQKSIIVALQCANVREPEASSLATTA